MSVTEYTGKRGRPSKYKPMLDRLVNVTGWHVIDRNQANRTQPSQLRVRYPGYDFKCERNPHGKFNLLARWVGD